MLYGAIDAGASTAAIPCKAVFVELEVNDNNRCLPAADIGPMMAALSRNLHLELTNRAFLRSYGEHLSPNPVIQGSALAFQRLIQPRRPQQNCLESSAYHR